MPRARPNAPSRETVTTIRDDGSRNFLHPADVSGRFTWARRGVALLLIGVYLALPFIPINGHPAVFLDVLNRRFYLFGLTFSAQDLWLAFFFISGLGFTLFLVTSLFGRLWCGWACPHTVFLEHVYRRIERLLEGPTRDQKKLDKLSWSDPRKLFRRGSKQLIFVFISAVIAHFFLAYFISIPQLWDWMTSSPLEHWHAFVFVFVATAILYYNFAWFREQLCLIICPYGRLQSALIDDDTLVIGYDEKRGEPRGNRKGGDFGDCIDCNRCVEVCPTGIDIRQGLQMECVGCSNCVDACDAIMDRYNRPRGLIRYDSLNGLEGRKTNIIRPRLFLYLFLLFLGAGVMTASFMQLKPANLMATRMTGSPYFVQEDGVRNQFNVRVVNKRQEPTTFRLTVQSERPAMEVRGFADPFTLEAGEEVVRPLILRLDGADYAGRFPVAIRLEGLAPNGEPAFVVEHEMEFVGPSPQLFRDREEEAAETAAAAPSDA